MFRFIAILLLLVSLAHADVFDGPPATMTPNIFGQVAKSDVLRVLTIEERVGLARTQELVRIPLFFHEGECDAPDSLAIFDGATQLRYQADDVRRDAAGKVARMHLYITLDLQPWERKTLQLRPGKNPAAEPMKLVETDDRVTLAGEDLSVTFLKNGAIAAIQPKLGKVTLADGQIAPSLKLIRQSGEKNLPIVRESEITYDQAFNFQIRGISWGGGPFFAKLAVKISPRQQPTDIAEYVYRIPRHGSWFSQMSLFYPDEPNTADVVGTNRQSLLRGHLAIGDGENQIVSIPAGLRQRTRTVFNFSNDAIVNRKSGISLMMIPAVQMATRGIKADHDNVVNFVGCPDFLRKPDSNSGSLRAFMAEARFVFSKSTDAEDLWRESRQYFQPLVAIIDEPWATPEHFSRFAGDVAAQYNQVRNWNGGAEAKAVLAHYKPDRVAAEIVLRTVGQDLDSLLPTQEAIDAAWKKFQGAGLLDPYTITYGRSAFVPLSNWYYPSPNVDDFVANLAEASRLVNGRVTDQGWPHVKSFANAVNMHIGTYLCGIYGGRKANNRDLVRWCLDATQNQSLLGNYGHGQRPYSMNVGDRDPSDQLYQSITDMYLRQIELVCNEDLQLHPSVYGRYSDCVDVNADVYQRPAPGAKPSKAGWERAAMFRGQAHDHRWENFAADPYLAMLQHADDPKRPGITEACYYLQRDLGLTMTWNTLMTNVFVPDALLSRGLKSYKPPSRPAPPADLQVTDSGTTKVLTWKPSEGKDVRGYRIYRATQTGGPWMWLNSPYTQMPPFVPPTSLQRQATTQPALGPTYKLQVPPIPQTLVRELRYTDRTPPAGAMYFVTAEDGDGRESRWFPDEPVPQASR